MKPEAQRVAIAKACGWKQVVAMTWSGDKLDPPKQFMVGCGHEPDYLNDLNAMHEAEKVLSMGQLVQYGNHINRMDLKYNYGYVECVINATASQRAEAFLRTIGKWTE